MFYVSLAVGSKRAFGSARCITRSENLTTAAQVGKFRKGGCPTAARWKGVPGVELLCSNGMFRLKNSLI